MALATQATMACGPAWQQYPLQKQLETNRAELANNRGQLLMNR